MEETQQNAILHTTLAQPGITLIYGPAGTGKTLLCLEAVAQRIQKGKIIYLDCHMSTFPFERLQQITSLAAETLPQRIFYLHPINFLEQTKLIRGLRELREGISLLVVDNITYLYRLKSGGYGKSYYANQALIEQVELLQQIAQTLRIPVIITSHVYASHNEKFRTHRIVGGKILATKANQIIALTDHDGIRLMRIQDAKHSYTITERGISLY